jgi:hypothetical protein
MYARLRATMMVAAAVFASANATAAQLGQLSASVPQAPIGHLQPRAPHFSPRSSSEQVEQDRMSAFDAEQNKLDQGTGQEVEHLPLLITQNERQI